MPEEKPIVHTIEEVAAIRREFRALIAAIGVDAKALLAAESPDVREFGRRLVEKVRAINRLEERLG